MLEMNQIVSAFIDPKTLNIGGKAYGTINTLFRKSCEENKVNPKVFDEGLVQIKHLIETDIFPRYLKRHETKNLTPRERHKRAILSVKSIVEALMYPLFLVQMTALINLQYTWIEIGYVLSVLKWFEGVHYALNAWYGV